MALITNYGELKTEVAKWLDRTDMADHIPAMVKLCESRIFRRLRTFDLEYNKVFTGADDPYGPIVLPQNYREITLVNLNGRPLHHISSQRFAELQSTHEHPDQPTQFAIINRQLVIDRWPQETGTDWGSMTLEIQYFGTESICEMATWDTPQHPNSVPETSGTAPVTSERPDDATSRLLQVAPDLYLYGVLSAAHAFLREDARIGVWKSQFEETMAEMESEQAMGELSGSTSEVSAIYNDSLRRYPQWRS